MPNSQDKAPSPPAIPPVSFVAFDTGKIERDLRYEAWQENIRVVFDVAPPDDSPPQDYQAKITAGHIGDTIIVQTSAPTQRFRRDQVRVRREEKDVILVQLFLRGGGIISGSEKVSAGDMLIIDLNQAYDMVSTDFENLTLVLPGHLHKNLADALEKLHDLRLSGDNPLVRLMGDHLRSLWHHLGAMNRQQADIAIQGTLGLLQSWLVDNGEVRDMANSAVEKALTGSIRRHIEQNLDQPLQADALAKTFKMSRAQLYRLFKLYGGVECYIGERRLQRSLRMLSQPRFAKLNIAAIAFACGFSSEAHFSRKFRETFGMTPGQARGETLAYTARQPGNIPLQAMYSIEFRELFETFTARAGTSQST